MFKNIKIRTKLLLGFGLVIFLIVVIVAVTLVNSLGVVEKQIEDIREHEVPAAILLQEIESDILEGIKEAFAYLLLNDLTEKAKFLEKMSEVDELFSKFETVAAIGTAEEEEESALFRKIEEGQLLLLAHAERMFTDFEKEGVVNSELVVAFEESVDEILPLINEFVEIEFEEVKEALSTIEKSNEQTIAVTLTTGSLALILALLFSYVISRSISRSVTEARNVAIEVARGNMYVKIDTSG